MTIQRRIGSGFGATSTARDVIGARRLDGKIAIVTGGYAGIGLETTRVLADAGATVIVPARSEAKARAALEGMPRVEIDALDLADPASIDAFAARFVASGRPLHLLIANAGIMAVPFARDARGFETHLATNHFGHYALTRRVWPSLVAARGARVVVLSSRGHARAGVDFDDPHFVRRPYDKWIAYGQSKTANALFARALDARGASLGIRSFSVHPGAIAETDLGRAMPSDEMAAAVARAKTFGGLKTVPQGAATTIWCATNERLADLGGVYCEDGDIAEAVPADHDGPTGVRPWAVDAEAAERLWRMTEESTGIG